MIESGRNRTLQSPFEDVAGGATYEIISKARERGTLMGMKGFSHRPEVIHEQVKNAQNDNEHDGAEFRLESYNNHHTRYKAQDADENAPEAPFPGKNKPDEEEYQQHAPSELEVHLPVLLINLRQSCWSKFLPHPGIREHHKKTAHNREIAEEEVQVKYKAITERLGNNDAE